MDLDLAQRMDEDMVGPRLFCRYCRKNSILAMCLFCQHKGKDKEFTMFCRGCGQLYCEDKYEVCQILTKEKVMLQINKAIANNWETLNLDNLCVKELPAKIGSLTKIAQLHLCGNKLTQFPSEIAKLTNLTYLDIRNNPISQDEVTKLKEVLPNCDIHSNFDFD